MGIYARARHFLGRVRNKLRVMLWGPPPPPPPRPIPDVVHDIVGFDGILWCIDSASFVWGYLGMRGWLLHESKHVDHWCIVAILPDGTERQLELNQRTPRESVRDAYPESPDGLYSGYVGITYLNEVDRVTLEVRVTVEGELHTQVMGVFDNLFAHCDPVDRDGVLVLCEGPATASRRYRGEHLVEQLEKRGVRARLALIEHLDDDCITYRHIVLQRSYLNALFKPLVLHFREGGGHALFEVDDAVITYELRMENDHLKQFPKQQKADTEFMRDVMDACDAYITTTGPLKELLEQEFPNKQTFLSPNVASDEMLRLSQAALEERTPVANGFVRMGYFSGSATHNSDFETIVGALAHALEDCPEARLVLVGDLDVAEGPLSAYEDRIERVRPVPWQELPKLVAGVDINLIPLVDTRFNECKSAIKWMEAALVGVPTVAVRNRELARVIEDGVTGLLCTSEAEWHEALVRLIRDHELRYRLADAARTYTYENLTTNQMNEELLAYLSESESNGGEAVQEAEALFEETMRDFMVESIITPAVDLGTVEGLKEQAAQIGTDVDTRDETDVTASEETDGVADADTVDEAEGSGA